MIYTEYFVKGTQPTALCPLHPDTSFMDRLAGVFGGGDHPETAVKADEAGLPPEHTGTSGASRPVSAVPALGAEEPEKASDADDSPKKRGFWGRLFGKGGSDDKKPAEKKKPGAR
jgi:hypothetical protein